MNELARWCPSLVTFKFYGNMIQRNAQRQEMSDSSKDVIVTSYDTITSEFGSFKSIRWRCIVIDEGHKVKNESSIISRCVRTLDSQFKLLLTGTPVQNNTRELWSILSTILPAVFGSDGGGPIEWRDIDGSKKRR
eukprot:TRINITY_DN15885_c0_g1_i2.p1 TRINITY_DN15885_c0_g1~~TRINITY_DN15885_c0_g1_i2.p1  ORF type:complete len:135 (-),score=28.54 TRINITY_DN15885_c0_g1_i2:205-609(-)